MIVSDVQIVLGKFLWQRRPFRYKKQVSRILAHFNSPPLEYFETEIFNASTLVYRVGMLNENEEIVIDFEGFKYINLISEELTVKGKIWQDTLLFKPPKDLIACSIAQRRSTNLFTRRIHGIGWNSGFYPNSFVNGYFVSLRIRFPKVTVFVKGKNKAQFNSKYLENVRGLEDFGCPRIKEIKKEIVVSCPSHSKIEPWKPDVKFWPFSRLKAALLLQWIEKFKNANPDGDQSDVFNVNSSFECLHVSRSKQWSFGDFDQRRVCWNWFLQSYEARSYPTFSIWILFTKDSVWCCWRRNFGKSRNFGKNVS